MEKERGFLIAFSLLYMEEWWLSQGKVLVQLLQLWVELPAFFMDHHVDLKVPLTDALWWFSLVDLADIFLHMNTVSRWLQGKHLEESVASYKIWTFKWTLEFLDSFPILKDFSNEIGSDFFFFLNTGEFSISTFGRSALLSKPLFSTWPMHTVTKSGMSTRFKGKDKSTDFNVTEYEKLTDMAGFRFQIYETTTCRVLV